MTADGTRPAPGTRPGTDPDASAHGRPGTRPPARPQAGPGDSPPASAGFARALNEAAEIAALSPSSHNCQPWGLARLTGRDARQAAAARLGGTAAPGETADREYLALALDADRSIGALASHAVEMVVSCGAYARLLLRALECQGWAVTRIDFPAGDAGPALAGADWPAHWTLLALVELRRAGPPDSALESLRGLAGARRTNRAPYAQRPVDAATLAALERPAAHRLPADGTVVRHLTGGDVRRFTRLVARYGGLDFSHGAAWRETHSFIRRDDTEAAALGTGFTLTQLFGPLSAPRSFFLRCALAPRTMRFLRFTGYHRVLARKLAAVVRRSPVVSVLSWGTAEPDRARMVLGGMRLADYWLRATRAGLALHPVSVVIEHDGPRREVERAFGLPGRVFFVARLGHPSAEFPPAPRRPATSCLRTL